MASKQQTAFASATPRLTMRQIALLIATTGHQVSFIVEGDMGSGKTSLLKMIAEMTKMRPVYFDCTTKDPGDVFLPRFKDFNDGADAVAWVPNEEFGIHHGDDVVLMFDEIGKNRALVNPLLRVLQERCVGNRPLTQRSIVFATTNLGAEGIGDLLPPHARNRVCVVRMLKPGVDEWVTWGLDNGINPMVLAFAKSTPQMFESFTDIEDPKSNEYIYDPRAPHRTAFVTNRSLHKASSIMDARPALGDEIVTEALKGTIGAKAAIELMTYTKIGDQLPTFDEIVTDPKKARLGDGAIAPILTALMLVGRVQPDTFNAVFTYVERMPMEHQMLFAKQMLDPAGSKQRWVCQMDRMTKFLLANQRMFAPA